MVVIEALAGLTMALVFPAYAGLVPQLVPRDELQQANALNAVLRNGFRVLGPALGGVLVVTVGPGWALAFDAATWLVASLLLAPVQDPGGGARGAVLDVERPARGLEPVHRHHLVVGRGARLRCDERHLGRRLEHARPGARRRHHRRPRLGAGAERGGGRAAGHQRGAAARAARAAAAARHAGHGRARCADHGVRAHRPPRPAGRGGRVLAGAGVEVFGIGWSLAMQEHVDDRLLSRAYSYDALGSFVAIPVGQLLFGPLGAAYGLADVMVVSGVVYVLVALSTLLSRSVRTLPRARAADAAVGSRHGPHAEPGGEGGPRLGADLRHPRDHAARADRARARAARRARADARGAARAAGQGPRVRLLRRADSRRSTAAWASAR